MEPSDEILSSRYMLSGSTRGISDRLGMTQFSGLAFGWDKVLVLVAFALAWHAIGRRQVKP